jgi:hypothetical protein
MVNCPRADVIVHRRGFAVVFAEDVPEVSTTDVAPGTSNRTHRYCACEC